MRIGILDSGIGGLTVLKELIKYPNEYYYCGDNINIPYGTKSIEELKLLSCKIIDFLLTKNVDLIIIACGTISTNILEYLKNKYNIPIYDIISPVLDRIDDDTTVLATPMTVKSNKFVNAIACPLLVPLIEKNEDCTEVLKKYLFQVKTNKIVLGCTHYPILTDKIKEINSNLEIINMGKILCNKLQLPNNNLKINLFFTKVDKCLINNINKIISNDYKIEKIKL